MVDRNNLDIDRLHKLTFFSPRGSGRTVLDHYLLLGYLEVLSNTHLTYIVFSENDLKREFREFLELLWSEDYDFSIKVLQLSIRTINGNSVNFIRLGDKIEHFIGREDNVLYSHRVLENLVEDIDYEEYPK